MLSDTALIVTGVAFAAIIGGAWALHRSALAVQQRPEAPGRQSPSSSEPEPPGEAPLMRSGSDGSPLARKAAAASAATKAGGSGRASSHAANVRTEAVEGVGRGREGSKSLAQMQVETQVLRAAVGSALEQLADVYGPEYVDAFYARRVRRNVVPYRKLAGSVNDAGMAQTALRQASAAEAALQGVSAMVLAKVNDQRERWQ